MKKYLGCILMFLLTSIVCFGQKKTFIIRNEADNKAVEGVTATLFTQLTKRDTKTIELLATQLSDEQGKVTFVLPKKKDFLKRFLVVKKDGFKSDTITNLKNTDILLTVNASNQSFQIKLMTLSKPLNPQKLEEWRNLLDVEKIGLLEPRETDEQYSYATNPIPNFRTCLSELNRITNLGVKGISEAYIIHTSSHQRLFFRYLFKTHPKKRMQEEMNVLGAELQPHQLDQIQTTDGYYRIVSAKHYTNFQEAKSAFFKIPSLRLFAKEARIMIYIQEKNGVSTKVIDSLSLVE